ncbi:MAG: hypothetical protein ACFFD3_13680 [Candidatus Thorarchaeota archaeon]
MEVKRSICCRELKKTEVVGSMGEPLGRIGDMTFKFDGNLKLSQFILVGRVFEELLESLRVRKDYDPVFDASMIKRMDEKIHLTTSKNNLRASIEKGAIGSDEIRLSKLTKLRILDKNGLSVGKAIDVDFDVDGSASLIVGGGFFEEKLEAFGLKADVDIIVPSRVIESIGDVIRLSVGKEELALTMEEAIKSSTKKKAKDTMINQREVSRVQLFAQRPR